VLKYRFTWKLKVLAIPPRKGLTQQDISWQQVGQNFRTYQENPSVIVLGNNNQNLSYAFGVITYR